MEDETTAELEDTLKTILFDVNLCTMVSLQRAKKYKPNSISAVTIFLGL